MSVLMIPFRQQDQLALLVQASARYRQQLERESSALNPVLGSELQRLARVYEAAIAGMEATKRERSVKVLALSVKLETLGRVIRDVLEMTRRRARREPGGEALGRLFQVDTRLLSRAQRDGLGLVQLGQQLVEAEAAALARGFAPSAGPSIEDVKDAMAGSEDLFHEVERLSYESKEAQVQVREIQEEVIPQLRHLGSILRLHYRKHSKMDRRVLMRTYGFRFKSETDPDEPNEDASNEGAELKTEPIVLGASMTMQKDGRTTNQADFVGSQAREVETKPTSDEGSACTSAATGQAPSDRPNPIESQAKAGEEGWNVAESARGQSPASIERSQDQPPNGGQVNSRSRLKGDGNEADAARGSTSLGKDLKGTGLGKARRKHGQRRGKGHAAKRGRARRGRPSRNKSRSRSLEIGAVEQWQPNPKPPGTRPK